MFACDSDLWCGVYTCIGIGAPKKRKCLCLWLLKQKDLYFFCNEFCINSPLAQADIEILNEKISLLTNCFDFGVWKCKRLYCKCFFCEMDDEWTKHETGRGYRWEAQLRGRWFAHFLLSNRIFWMTISILLNPFAYQSFFHPSTTDGDGWRYWS